MGGEGKNEDGGDCVTCKGSGNDESYRLDTMSTAPAWLQEANKAREAKCEQEAEEERLQDIEDGREAARIVDEEEDGIWEQSQDSSPGSVTSSYSGTSSYQTDSVSSGLQSSLENITKKYIWDSSKGRFGGWFSW